MQYDEQIHDLIDQYLADELPSEERTAFEKRLQQNTELQELVRLNQEVRETLADRGEADLRATLKKISAQNTGNPGKIRPMWRRAVAAVALLAIIPVAWVLLRSGTVSPDEIYAEHFQAETMEFSDNLRRNMDGKKLISVLESAELAYDNGSYERALEYFKQILEDEPDNFEVRIYAGKSAALAEDYQQAVDLLIPVSNSNSPFRNEAIWNLALINIKQGKLDEGQKRLEYLSREGDPEMIPTANKLLKDLKRQ